LELPKKLRLKNDMPRKVRLTPMQRDVLWMLEEAGEESMITIQVTLLPPNSESLDSAIVALSQLGYVLRSDFDGHDSLILTKEGRRALTV
jgi:hypothetical protein